MSHLRASDSVLKVCERRPPAVVTWARWLVTSPCRLLRLVIEPSWCFAFISDVPLLWHSVFVGKQQRGEANVPFRHDSHSLIRLQGVGTEEPGAFADAQVVLRGVGRRDVAPIASGVPVQKVVRKSLGPVERLKCAWGGD